MRSTRNRTLGGPQRALASLCQLGLAAAVLLSASGARAQFANHAIGFQAGYLAIDRAVGAGGGPVLGIESNLYIENGFELTFRVLGGIHEEIVSSKNAVGFFPALGVRYLLAEDSLRPYVGASLAFMHFFGSDILPGALFAFSPFAGLEFFVDSSTAVAIQGEYQRLLVLNGNGGNAFAGLARISWGF